MLFHIFIGQSLIGTSGSDFSARFCHGFEMGEICEDSLVSLILRRTKIVPLPDTSTYKQKENEEGAA